MIDKGVFAKYIFHTCGSCAREIYGTAPPNASYADAVHWMLFGTIAHESDGLTATRQHKFSWPNDRGAWGLAQCELGSVTESLKYLAKRPDVAKRAAVWLNNDADADLNTLLYKVTPSDVLRLLPMSDRLSVLFCRLHYLRVPAAIPRARIDQDAYYKKYYNTIHGAAKPGDFIKALERAMMHVKA